MIAEYLGVLVLLGVAITLAVAMMIIQVTAGPKRSFPAAFTLLLVTPATVKKAFTLRQN